MIKNPVIALVGPQGSGKGTQAAKLVSKFGFQIVVAGDIVRGEAEKDTERGRFVKETTETGNLLPDEVITELLLENMSAVDHTKGIVIDGYPRTIGQAKELDEIVRKIGRENDLIFVLIEISDEEAFKRIAKRAQCDTCGIIYKDPGLAQCIKCGGPLEVREDDKDVESVKNRLAQYHEKTVPAIEYYREKGKLVEVNGEQTIEEVFDEMISKLEEHKKP